MENSQSNHFSDIKPQYQIQFIFNCKIVNSKAHYLVKWSNLPIEKATWEKQERIPSALQKIADYLKKLQKSSNYTTQEDIIDEILLADDLKYNPYELTNYQGHFLYADIPQRVKAAKTFQTQDSKKVFVLIEWQPRKPNQLAKYADETEPFKPRDTWLELEECVEHAPNFISAYLESTLVLNLIGQEQQGKESQKKPCQKFEDKQKAQEPKSTVKVTIVKKQSHGRDKIEQKKRQTQLINLVEDSDSCVIIQKPKTSE